MRYNVNAKGNRRLMVAYGIIAVLLIFTILPMVFIPDPPEFWLQCSLHSLPTR